MLKPIPDSGLTGLGLKCPVKDEQCYIVKTDTNSFLQLDVNGDGELNEDEFVR